MNQLDALADRLTKIERKQDLGEERMRGFSFRQVLAVSILVVHTFLLIALLWAVNALYAAVTAPG